MKKIIEMIEKYNNSYPRKLVFDNYRQLVVESVNGVFVPLNFAAYFHQNQRWDSRDFGITTNVNDEIIDLIIEVADELVSQEALKEGLLNEANGVYYPVGLGVCHSIWAMKRSHLKEKYGIIWQSPSELNPTILFV